MSSKMSLSLKLISFIALAKLVFGLDGEHCEAEQRPFAVTIFTKTPCGGSLITMKMVLTAARCIEPEQILDNTRVEAGLDSDPTHLQVRYLNRTILHGKYLPLVSQAGLDLRYDIGLIEVNASFTASSVVDLVHLPSPGLKAESCALATALYFKSVVEEKGTLDRPMKCLDVTNDENCLKIFPGSLGYSGVFCSKAIEDRNVCLGHSGGGVICKGEIVGVVSAYRCGNNSATSCTEIEHYLKWINKHIKGPEEKAKIKKRAQKIKEDKKNSDIDKKSVTCWKRLSIFSLIINFILVKVFSL